MARKNSVYREQHNEKVTPDNKYSTSRVSIRERFKRTVYQSMKEYFHDLFCPVIPLKLEDLPAVQSTGDRLARTFSPRVLTQSYVVQEL